MKGIDLDKQNGPLEVQYSDSANLDAFGRLRVSQVQTLIDIKYIIDDQPLLVDEVTSGTATASHSATNSLVNMTTSAASDYAIRQTFQRAHYQSGKSQQIFMTASNFHAQDTVTKRMGYFSSSTSAPHTALLDGLFLENDGTDVSINIYKIGTPTEQTAQTDWNLDTLDGSGGDSNPSGIGVDWEKNFILLIDFEWLGVGRVTWSLVLDGKIIRFHESNHTNMTLETPYMQSPNQPLRWEIRQSGVGSGTFDTICATVGTEGALNKVGKVLGDDLTSVVSANSTSNIYALIGIRHQTGKFDNVIDILDFSILATTADNQIVRVIINPTVAGTFTYNSISNSSVQIAKGSGSGNTVTGGTVILTKYVAAQQDFSFEVEQAIKLGISIAGTRDEIVLTTQPLTSNSRVLGSINWEELA